MRALLNPERLTRLFILAAALVALSFQTVMGMRLSASFGAWVAIAFLGAAALTHVRPALGMAVVTGIACLTPAIQRELVGYYGASSTAIWMAALLGVVVATTRTGGWSMPLFWKLALGMWALAVAVTFPIIVLREADFTWALLSDDRVWTTSEGVTPAVSGAWTASVVTTQLLGVLWIDALFAAARAGINVRRAAIAPLAAGAVVGAAVALYQMTVDISFMNETVFGGLGRASGLMQDGNAFGIVTAMWIGGAVALAVANRARLAAGVAAGAMCALAVWSSGSRTALLAALFSLAAAAIAVWRWLPTRRAKVWSLAAAMACVLAAAAAIATRPAIELGPLERVRSFMKDNDGEFRQLIVDLWNREGYGATSSRIIEEFPLTGAGVGSFHILVLDYSKNFARGVKPDNAQNWLRHILAEMGVLGAAGCLAWVLWFLAFIAGRGRRPLTPASIAVIGALAGLGFASMLGVPTQDVIVLVTFWTFVFWFVDETARPEVVAPRPARARAWAAVVAVVLLFSGVTLWAGRNRLSVPQRAQAGGWEYNYGLHALDNSGGGLFRWTSKRAVAVFPAHTGFLRLTYWVHHPDLSSAPVRVRVWRQGDLVIDERLADQNGRTVYLYNRGAHPWMMLRVEVDRTWRPDRENGVRELGVALADWQFVPAAPPGAIIIP